MHERTEERYYLRTRTAWCAKASRGLVFKGLYINLERSNARRQRIEGELFGLGLGTLYNRLPATDGATSEQRPPLRAGELGCYLSHLRALEIAAESDRPMHILEDDARLSKLVPAVLPAANRLFQNADIVFLDVALPYELAIWQMYRDHIRPGQLSVINLAGSAFSSTTSYVVSPQGPERFAISVQQNLTTRHADRLCHPRSREGRQATGLGARSLRDHAAPGRCDGLDHPGLGRRRRLPSRPAPGAILAILRGRHGRLRATVRQATAQASSAGAGPRDQSTDPNSP